MLLGCLERLIDLIVYANAELVDCLNLNIRFDIKYLVVYLAAELPDVLLPLLAGL